MRNETRYFVKDKVHSLIVDGRLYRSQHCFYLNDQPVMLAVEKVEGKPETVQGSRFFDAGYNPSIAIPEAKIRYPKNGAHALVKAALVLNEAGQPIEKVALKCFFSNLDGERSTILEVAEQEAAYWRSRGQNAYVFSRPHSHTKQKIYFVMPWVNGYDLQQLCEAHAKAHSIAERMDILTQIFQELRFFHEKGQIVSDLKLDNVMFDPETKKITLVDVSLIPNHSKARAFTADFLESKKRLAYEHDGEYPILDEKDVLYAFGMLARYLLATGPFVSPEDAKLGFVLSTKMQQIFCNPKREERPSCVNFQDLLKSASGYSFYRHNPYTLMHGARVHLDINELGVTTVLTKSL